MAVELKPPYPYFMVTNRRKTSEGLTEKRSDTLSFFECDARSDPVKFSSWSPLTQGEFIKRLQDVGDSFKPEMKALKAQQERGVLIDEFNTEQKHLSLFVHGYNTDWEDAVKRYKQIKRDLYDKTELGALVLYTWPSNGSSAGYLPDREDARKSGEQTADLFTILHEKVYKRELAAERSGDPLDRCYAKISVIAHSMGNYVTQKGLAVAAKRLNSPQLVTLIHQLVMVAADVDNDLFQKDRPDSSDGSLMANLCYRISALYTGLDSVLGASAGLKHFGKRRLGRSGLEDDETVYDNVFDWDVSALIDKKEKIHSAVFTSPASMQLLEEILRGIDRKHLLKAA